MASLQAIIFHSEISDFTCFLPFLWACITVVANILYSQGIRSHLWFID